jgi:hypothetical protein
MSRLRRLQRSDLRVHQCVHTQEGPSLCEQCIKVWLMTNVPKLVSYSSLIADSCFPQRFRTSNNLTRIYVAYTLLSSSDLDDINQETTFRLTTTCLQDQSLPVKPSAWRNFNFHIQSELHCASTFDPNPRSYSSTSISAIYATGMTNDTHLSSQPESGGDELPELPAELIVLGNQLMKTIKLALHPAPALPIVKPIRS